VPALQLHDSPVHAALTDAGFARTPRGLRLR
jgi:ATP-dependent Lhr-like helicase